MYHYQLIQVANNDKIYVFSYHTVSQLIAAIKKDYSVDNKKRFYGNKNFVITRFTKDYTFSNNINSPTDELSMNDFKAHLEKWVNEELKSYDVNDIEIHYPETGIA